MERPASGGTGRGQEQLPRDLRLSSAAVFHQFAPQARILRSIRAVSVCAGRSGASESRKAGSPAWSGRATDDCLI